MKLTLCDLNPEVASAFRHIRSRKLPVAVHEGSFLDLTADAIVSPANSYGYMNGGIDLAYRNYFGYQIQEAVQKVIRDEWKGELPVGCAITVPTGNDKFPYMISAPTMLIPADISGTNNVFLAAHAALKEAYAQGFTSLVMPGLGTGVGRMDPLDCAIQIQFAISKVTT